MMKCEKLIVPTEQVEALESTVSAMTAELGVKSETPEDVKRWEDAKSAVVKAAFGMAEWIRLLKSKDLVVEIDL
jgi:hypothetical protein